MRRRGGLFQRQPSWMVVMMMMMIMTTMAVVDAVDSRGSAGSISQGCDTCPDIQYSLAPSASATTRPPTFDSQPWQTVHHPSSGGVDFLVAAFFLIAAGWLILALLYSILVLIVIRLRARGELDIYDENFGRIFLLGRRCYIPLGCILRRYVVALYNDQDTDVRFMTREERRTAMESLLATTTSTNGVHGEEEEAQALPENLAPTATTSVPPYALPETNTPNQDTERGDDESSDEPVCSICLMEYESGDVCFSSTMCAHRFHRECILDWLERRANTECPCCRIKLVRDEDVWEVVERNRQELRRQKKKSDKSILSRLVALVVRGLGCHDAAAAATAAEPSPGVAQSPQRQQDDALEYPALVPQPTELEEFSQGPTVARDNNNNHMERNDDNLPQTTTSTKEISIFDALCDSEGQGRPSETTLEDTEPAAPSPQDTAKKAPENDSDCNKPHANAEGCPKEPPLTSKETVSDAEDAADLEKGGQPRDVPLASDDNKSAKVDDSSAPTEPKDGPSSSSIAESQLQERPQEATDAPVDLEVGAKKREETRTKETPPKAVHRDLTTK